MTHYQTTLRERIAFEGVGLHSGVPCRVEIRPASPGTGLRFVSAGVVIPALAEYVVETARATVIGKDGVTISTVEHVLAALSHAPNDERLLNNLALFRARAKP